MYSLFTERSIIQLIRTIIASIEKVFIVGSAHSINLILEIELNA